MVAVLGVIASLVLIRFTAGISLIGLPIVFGYIVAAQPTSQQLLKQLPLKTQSTNPA